MYHKLGGLKQQKSSVTVLETGCPGSRCQQGRAVSESSREAAILGFSSFWRLLAILGYGSITPALPGVLLCVCVSGSKLSSFYKDTSHIGLALTLMTSY